MDEDIQKKIEELEAQLAELKKKAPDAGEGKKRKPKKVSSIAIGGDAEQSTLVAGDGNIIGDVHDGAQVIHVVGSTVIIGNRQVEMPAVDRSSALGRYLEHVIAQNHYLELQGIRSGGRLISVELEKIYITLRANWHRPVIETETWLANQASLAPGEERDRWKTDAPGGGRAVSDSSEVKVEEALARQKHLVVLGDPGSGKTTLLRYLALIYARDLAEGRHLVKEQLNLDESGPLPIFLPLRQVGIYLQAQPNDGTEGHVLLMQFLLKSLKNENVDLPPGFFEIYLNQGQAVVLLDGLDEVSDPVLRGRVAQLARNFARAYPNSRFVVTSRIVGYIETVRLGDDFTETTVRDFSLADIRAFLTRWHQAVAVSQMGPNQSAIDAAAGQTNQLVEAIQANERILDLAINPLMLTVIALIHRDQVKLPDRRAELYAEAVDVLLGKRDEARGIKEAPILEDRPFDTGDRRLLLQYVAFWMHEQGRKEIAVDDLRGLLVEYLKQRCGGEGEECLAAARRAAERFLHSVTERSGLIQARGEGVYAFSHLTFQEYLAAVALADRNDFIEYSLLRAGNDWWREVLLLEAGHLAKNGPMRATNLVGSIANCKKEIEPYHNLVLAAECIRDVGEARLEGGLAIEVRSRMRAALEKPRVRLDRQIMALLRRGGQARELIERRSVVATAFGRIGGVEYWQGPFGEPDWVEIPAGPFSMGNSSELHKVSLPRYWIARTPVTCAQYAIFIQASGHSAPDGWEGGRAPRGRELHPVVNVSWKDAGAYCQWLSQATAKRIGLPSEAEWEKAARGEQDEREYPWGNGFQSGRCNTRELGIGGTTPVGVFLEGASPYGVLDMAGNVWEWTRSLYVDYPYKPDDGREDLSSGGARVCRGGSWLNNSRSARCASRDRGDPDLFYSLIGFRPVLSLADSGF